MSIPAEAAAQLSEADLIERFAALPVANVGDAMDRLNVVDSGIQSVWPSAGVKMAGRAVPVTVAGGDNLGIHETIPTLQPGDVLVVNGQAATHRALIGELIAGRAMAQGCVGFVLDASVRDAVDLEQMRFPVFARGTTPAGPYRNGPFVGGVAAAVGTVVVHPGDLVLGDDDGVAVVPRSHAAEILVKAEAKHAAETKQRAEIGF
ncbi:methyltransferase [Citricoccus alkalitolerans]|uniref:Putative 4-hydroxy-4-methyl-2-oxoglutarate aldolase n=1 Tax=Citricoccus alkalitolerans TaxID=246603 RepID=A0ABV8Y1H1_9MICC